MVQLLQFQEDAFGRRVNNPALTKLPVSTTHTYFVFLSTTHTFCALFMKVIATLLKRHFVIVAPLSSGQVFPGFQGRRCSVSHLGVGLQVQERAGLVS